MRILVSNDDGIYSPGIAALARVARKFGQVRIVAPDVEQSSMGQAITSTKPISYKKTKIDGFDAFRVDGTPSDCVAVGVFNWDKVDLVLSGINLGTNLGNAVWHSGTLAAAKQGALFGLRGIAFSTPVAERDRGQEADFERVALWAERALELILQFPELTLVNVNIPSKPKGMCWTRQSCRHYDGQVVAGTDPMGRKNFWYTVVPVEETADDTDRWAMAHGCVALTPLRLDLTDDSLLEEVARRQAAVELAAKKQAARRKRMRQRPARSRR